ncbi:MAG: hypothetical protein RMA76_23720, partial [Deltaproteobacteria bacterium]
IGRGDLGSACRATVRRGDRVATLGSTWVHRRGGPAVGIAAPDVCAPLDELPDPNGSIVVISC